MSEKENRLSGMEPKSLFSGFVLDPSKCSQLSLEEKRELVHEIAQFSDNASEILSSFTRRELLQIICAEMGKERKYSGYSKHRMIKHLLKLISQKPSGSESDDFCPVEQVRPELGFKRKRQNPTRHQLSNDLNQVPPWNAKEKCCKTKFCQNAACKTSLSPDDAFCKRCSCCICHQFDDNKDPSLWLTCESDSLDENESCGMSCHLECALTDERVGIIKSNCCVKLDGSFYCVACGKINGLMRTWRKQLLVAKETRRVDVLCLRISLGHRILIESEKYMELQKTVETAMQILTNEVGPLNLLCTKLARGIVNRLSCGSEVQNLCASVIEAFDSLVSEPCNDHMKEKEPASCQIQFEELSPASAIIVLDYAQNLIKGFLGCRIWHRKSTENVYPDTPTFMVLRPQKRFKITDLNPSTEYFCKVSLFSRKGTLGAWEAKWVSPASSGNCMATLKSEKEEPLTATQIYSQVNSTNSSNSEPASVELDAKFPSLDEVNNCKDERFYSPPHLEKNSPLRPPSLDPSTPCKSQKAREIPGSNCKKRLEESDFEYSIRIVKWLEHEGHIDKDFRVKFLTWFSLKATKQERRVVSVFVNALIDDPACLAEQLIHTFMDKICCQRRPVSGHRFCARLWH
ncbi:hypothetical protein SLA2020_333560 [Shorea laevis]